MEVTYRPLIGITPQYDTAQSRAWIRSTYVNAVIAAGGIPVMLDQYTDRDTVVALVDRLDGILFSGGCDIHPAYYGEAIDPKCGTISDARDAFEEMLFSVIDQSSIPVLGICRGIQALNVFAGGSLHQHIDNHQDTRHTVKIAADSRLAAILGKTEIVSNSYHHQAVKVPAPGFAVTAHADDGTLEAIERTGERFFIGVQWHPEMMAEEEQKALFRAFTDACTVYAKGN